MILNVVVSVTIAVGFIGRSFMAEWKSGTNPLPALGAAGLRGLFMAFMLWGPHILFASAILHRMRISKPDTHPV
jgi:hypothetical protein